MNDFLEQEASSSLRKIIGMVCGLVSISFLGGAIIIVVLANHILIKDIGVLLTTIAIVGFSSVFGYLSYRLMTTKKVIERPVKGTTGKGLINIVGFFIFTLSSVSAIGMATVSQNKMFFIILGVLSAVVALYLLKKIIN